MLVGELAHLALSQSAGKTINGLAVDHQDDGGDAAHTKRLGQLLLLVGIDLDQLETAFVVKLELFQHWAQDFARRAPGGPKIHQHRNLLGRRDDFGFKVLQGNVDHGETLKIQCHEFTGKTDCPALGVGWLQPTT